MHELLVHYLNVTELSPTAQEMLWPTCRFSYLPAAKLVSLADQPNVPTRWLALACAQRAAASDPASSKPPAGASTAEAARLTPRDFYA